MKKIEKIEKTLMELKELHDGSGIITAKSEQKDELDDFLESFDADCSLQNKMKEDLHDDGDDNEDEDNFDNEEEEEENEEDNDDEEMNDCLHEELLESTIDRQAQDFEKSLAFLDDMVGMDHVKEKLLRLGHYAQWKRKLEFAGIDTSAFPQPNLTFMFLGAPGTGKTTVARQMGKILKSIGLLFYDSVFEFRREDLIGQNYGCEEENTKSALEDANDAVFFLDEAYQCFKQSTDKRDPGYHILETLMQHFDKPGRCIIMAGYKSEMMELFKVNPGFHSRIPDDNIIEFTGPSEQMLVDVANNAFRKMSLQVTADAHAMLLRHIHDMWTNKDQDFGNARVIRQLAESIVINHANRIMSTTHGDDFIINESDIRPCLSLQQIKSPTRSRIGFV